MLPVLTMPTALLLLSTSVATVAATLEWKNCTSSQVRKAGPDLQCAELSVPLNWTDPHSQNINVGLTRLRAKDDAKCMGSLVFSPGGPAEPASPLLGAQSLGISLFPENITTAFDIIGIDPRGVGPIGTPITCNPKNFNHRHSSYYPTEDQYNDILSANQAAWSDCASLTGPLLFNVDSRSVAHDLEALRVALDDGPLNLLALSYFTVAAQTYAQMYPNNFRTIVEDAVIDHSSSATAEYFDEAQAFESGLHRFAEWCNTTNTTTCPLSGKDVLAIYNETVTQAFDSSLPAPGCIDTNVETGGCFPNITGPEFILTTQNFLLFKLHTSIAPGWSELAQALVVAAQGNATAMAQAYAAANLAASSTQSTFTAGAMPCLDYHSDINSHSDIIYRLGLGSAVAPITRGWSFKWQQQLRCVGFPHDPTYPQQDMDVNNTTPLLIAQSEWDPNAAYVWAEEARNDIKNNSLVLRTGDGHTSYFTEGETTDIIGDYLLSGNLPPQNLAVPT